MLFSSLCPYIMCKKNIILKRPTILDNKNGFAEVPYSGLVCFFYVYHFPQKAVWYSVYFLT